MNLWHVLLALSVISYFAGLYNIDTYDILVLERENFELTQTESKILNQKIALIILGILGALVSALNLT